jgi:hypothetical protein
MAHRISSQLLILIAVVGFTAHNSLAQSCILLNGEASEYVWKGTTTFDSNMGSFSIQGNFSNGAEVSYNGLFPGGRSSWWTFDLAEKDKNPLAVASYYPAVRFPFNDGAHGIDFSGDGRGCNNQFGTFAVLDIAYDEGGVPTRLAADFEQHCENVGIALLGQVRMNTCGATYTDTCVGQFFAAQQLFTTGRPVVAAALTQAKRKRNTAIKRYQALPYRCRARTTPPPAFPNIRVPNASTAPAAPAPSAGFFPYTAFQRCQERLAFVQTKQATLLTVQQKIDAQNVKSTRLIARYKSLAQTCH